jgi:uncharacterized protein (DUF58 family)
MAVQTVADVLRKVRRVQIVANRVVNDLLAGEYHSVFKGRGMEFDEVREYQPGDEVRTIDWNVTARTGVPFVKRYREERELTVLFLVDVSASGVFGSGEQSKLDLVVEVAALLMFSALKNNDKVGLALFCDDVLRYFPPRKGKGNVLRFLRELITAKPVARETRLDRALEFLNRVQKRKAVVFVVSDFLGGGAGGKALSVANKRHDVVAVTVSDPRERTLPDVGFILLQDAESGETMEVDTRHPAVRRLFERNAADRAEALSGELRRAGVDQLAVDTGKPYSASLHQFFRKRQKQNR